jgi:hypothetical protein
LVSRASTRSRVNQKKTNDLSDFPSADNPNRLSRGSLVPAEA